MDRRRTLALLAPAAFFFWLGIQLGECSKPVPPTPQIAAHEIGLLDRGARRQLVGATARARAVWGEALALQEAGLQRQLDELLGAGGTWPEEPAEETTEAFFVERLLPEYMEQAGLSPRGVDCRSYPCVAVFAEAIPRDEEERFLDAVRGRNKLYRDWGKDRVLWQSEWGLNSGPDGAQWALMTWALLPPDASLELRQRTQLRLRWELIEQRRLRGLVPGG